jgi:hypothetical protein
MYASSIAGFGGTTQLVITWLIHLTGNPMAPEWYLFGAGIVGQAALWLMLESAPVRTSQAAITFRFDDWSHGVSVIASSVSRPVSGTRTCVKTAPSTASPAITQYAPA